MDLKDVDFTHNVAATFRTMQEHGLLLTSVSPDGRPDTMAIGIGHIGPGWPGPCFVVYVRPSRYTYECIEANGAFVVSVPTDEMHDAVWHCGSVSGRDNDKFADCGFTTTPAATVGVPLIDQCVMHYECRVVGWTDIVEDGVEDAVRSKFYADGDYHRIYFGQILRTVERT